MNDAGEAAQNPSLFIDKVERCYKQGDSSLDILRGADLALWAGQSVALIAPSGAGNSTLLKSLSRIPVPTRGSV